MALNQHRIEAFIARQLDRPRLARARDRYRKQINFLVGRVRPEGAFGLALTIVLVALVAAGWALGAIIRDVLAHENLVRVDEPALKYFAEHREAGLTTVLSAVSRVGATAYLVPLIVVVGLIWLLRRRTWRPFALLASACAGTELLHSVIKVLVGRARPPLSLATGRFQGFAFPSGHAAQVVAVYGMIAFLLVQNTGYWTRRVAYWGIAVVVALLVGVSRVYLGAHWVTDVLGGYALGGTWLFALLVLERIVANRPILGGRPPHRRLGAAIDRT